VRETTSVVGVGGGPAGLTLANLLVRKRDRLRRVGAAARTSTSTSAAGRDREYRAVRMLEDWGLADRVPRRRAPGLRLEAALRRRVAGHRGGRVRPVAGREPVPATGAGAQPESTCCVSRRRSAVRRRRRGLARTGRRAAGGHLHGRGGRAARDRVRFPWRAATATRGVSRTSVPEGALTRHVMDHGLTWLTCWPTRRRPDGADGDRSGRFAAHFGRGSRGQPLLSPVLGRRPDRGLARGADLAGSARPARRSRPGHRAGHDREVFALRSRVYDR